MFSFYCVESADYFERCGNEAEECDPETKK